MKKNKTTVLALSLSCVGIAAVAFAASNSFSAFGFKKSFTFDVAEAVDRTGSPKQSYLIDSEDAEYIDFLTGFSGGVNNPDFARYRNDTFWDERYRYFGMDYFCDTFKGGGDNWKGTFTSREFNQNGNPYICFQFGGDSTGNTNKCVIEAKGEGDSWTEISTTYNNYFNDPLVSCQLVLRVVEVPAAYRDSTLRARFVDDRDGGFGLMTFGAFTGACTLDSAAKLFNLYKLALTDYRYDGSTATDEHCNAAASAHIKNILDTNSEYSAVRTRAEALGEVNNICDGFETAEGYPTFTEDYLFSDNGDNGGKFNVFTNSFRSDLSVYNWASHSPFNKTGDYFLSPEMNANGEALHEPYKARFFSSPFILRGSGYISIKMAGRSAKFTVWDADSYAELYSVCDDDDANQRIFDDKGWSVEGVCANGSRLGTMTRVYIDLSDLIGRKLFVSLEDYRTGGDWGLARFDEFVSFYETTPTIGYDVITQTHDNVTGYGVVRDLLYRGQANDPAQDNHPLTDAFNFLENTYFKLARAYSNTNPASFCSGTDSVDSTIKSAVATAYNALTAGAKAIVNTAPDYQYSGYGTQTPMYQTSLITTYSVGQALVYMGIIQ